MSENFNSTETILLTTISINSQNQSKPSNLLSILIIVLLTTIGLTGNSIACFLLSRPKLMKETLFHYYFYNSIGGMIGIILIWGHFLPIYLNIEWTSIYCKIYLYFAFSGYQVYPWVNALNSIDRFISLKYPTKFPFRKKFIYHHLAMWIVILISFTTNFPYILYEVRNPDGTDFKCYIENESLALYISAYSLVISNLSPFCVILYSYTLLDSC